MAALYDRIGIGYANKRVPDPRWTSAITAALDDAETVLNVGAGAGSYEPTDRPVLALEPSEAMIRQRPDGSAPVIRGVAGALPFADRAFDAALAILTTHHWPDVALGIAEMRRVAPRQVVVTWDPNLFAQDFWLLRDYLPGLGERESGLAAGPAVARHLNVVSSTSLLVPHDCSDGFLGAYWRRPEHYLDPAARASISGLAILPPNELDSMVERLAADLASGEWRERNGELLELDELDLGYQVIVGES